jgi:soluble lytic murein transglycosylase
MPVILLTSLLLIFSCSSGKTLPPARKVINTYEKNLKDDPKAAQKIDLNRMKENERQAFVYLQAANFIAIENREAACDRYKYLGKDKSFPLAQLSLIKSLKVCSYTKLGSFLLWKRTLKEVFPENRELFLTNSMILAKKLSLDDYYVQFSIDYTDYLKTKKEKEKHLSKLLRKYKKEKDLYIKIQEKFLTIAPRFIKRPTSNDYLSVAKDFSRVRKFAKARAYYKLIYRDSARTPLERMNSYYKYAFTYKLQRQKKKYSWQLERLVEWAKMQFNINNENLDESNKFWELNILLARAQWTVNFRSRAEKTLSNILKLGPPSYKAHSYFLLGKIESEKKNYKESEKYFKLGLAQSEIEDQILQELSWSLGFNYYLGKEYAKAKEVFFSAQGKTKDETFKKKLIFWQAKILKNLNQNGEASSLFKAVVNSDPYGYYGIISAMELETALPPVKKEQHLQRSPLHSLEWALAMKDFELAKSYLQEFQSQASETDEIIELLPHYSRAKWYDGGIAKFFKIKHDDRHEALVEFLDVAYPAPYKDLTQRIERRQKVPSELIYAIARQESAFNPRARSWADAFGLLQLTPEKAKSLASKLKIPYGNYNDLYREDTNLWLGAALLKILNRDMGGSFIATTASYNAGKKPVKGWMKRRKLTRPFEFIEAIPYKETQKYVKLVLRNYSIYRRLQGKTWSESPRFLYKNLF